MSGTYPARVIVLRKTKLGEADLIVTLISSEGRQIRAVAKGARKPGSKFGARVEPFTVADVLLARGRSLDVLTEAETVATHERLRNDYDAVRAASVVADFLDRITEECDAEPRLFELGAAALGALEGAQAAARPSLVAAFLVKAMAMQGFRPQLAGCVTCGSPGGTPTAFSLEGGGVVCSACSGSDPSAIGISPELAQALAWLLGARLAEVASQPLPEVAEREAIMVLRAFVAYHVPARIRALDAYVRG
ncbi:DNA repair protein RecO [Coriobacteriia bacterium Es71-Z0120]|uniref:DNA repair protein RecO n=1 Tax=Parvivirga hydrogeniphila TaxID=2939460 RepID=UPI002260D388|nr:DNA repair protein RecO [Parvivirga hydrogeniphila]MCL4079000.1 DNA repair protein RecO [Parvivirga hydrogeniphila]